ncbi:hypothetical protein KKF34_03880 [Myxococcota bacterium]|nr:hypothetical protein [Myxococcota bacterium]MBU1381283.1 hypothetical protein [Myxococcota bacterium]MBU1495995.1 hypothetical protein [Myxococcota bacterium]
MKGSFTGLILLTFLILPFSAKGENPTDEFKKATSFYKRYATAAGPIHVWKPAGYNHKTAGTVIYAHGYYIDADKAWKNHRLAKQFADSKKNAIFIVPEVPSDFEEHIPWTTFDKLLLYAKKAGVVFPKGRVVVMGHSGAYRTIVKWLPSKQINEIYLLDALYLNHEDFKKWALKRKSNRLIALSELTYKKSLLLMKDVKTAVLKGSMPDDGEFTEKEKKADILVIKSQYDHFAMIETMKVIPSILNLSKLLNIKKASVTEKKPTEKKQTEPQISEIH